MRPTLGLRMLQPTRRLLRPVPNEEQAGHTVSQRLRKLRKVPPELLPLGIVVAFALTAAGYSISRHFLTDKNLRLSRQGPNHNASEEHH